MLKTVYHISIKGYAGDYNFDRSTVDRELAKNEGKQVNVLIDSLGGPLATGLSISAAFKIHGNVNVHFVGLNASAITNASLGVSHFQCIMGENLKSPQNHSILQIFTIQILSSFQPCLSDG